MRYLVFLVMKNKHTHTHRRKCANIGKFLSHIPTTANGNHSTLSNNSPFALQGGWNHINKIVFNRNIPRMKNNQLKLRWKLLSIFHCSWNQEYWSSKFSLNHKISLLTDAIFSVAKGIVTYRLPRYLVPIQQWSGDFIDWRSLFYYLNGLIVVWRAKMGREFVRGIRKWAPSDEEARHTIFDWRSRLLNFIGRSLYNNLWPNRRNFHSDLEEIFLQVYIFLSLIFRWPDRTLLEIFGYLVAVSARHRWPPWKSFFTWFTVMLTTTVTLFSWLQK